MRIWKKGTYIKPLDHFYMYIWIFFFIYAVRKTKGSQYRWISIIWQTVPYTKRDLTRPPCIYLLTFRHQNQWRADSLSQVYLKLFKLQDTVSKFLTNSLPKPLRPEQSNVYKKLWGIQSDVVNKVRWQLGGGRGENWSRLCEKVFTIVGQNLGFWL